MLDLAFHLTAIHVLNTSSDPTTRANALKQVVSSIDQGAITEKNLLSFLKMNKISQHEEETLVRAITKKYR